MNAKKQNIRTKFFIPINEIIDRENDTIKKANIHWNEPATDRPIEGTKSAV